MCAGIQHKQIVRLYSVRQPLERPNSIRLYSAKPAKTTVGPYCPVFGSKPCLKLQNKKRQTQQARKSRKVKNKAAAVLPFLAKGAHKGVGNAGPHAANNAGQGRKQRRVLKARFNNKHAA